MMMMMMFVKTTIALLSAATLVGAQPTPDVTPMDFDHDGFALQGYFAEPESADNGLLPAIVIIPYVSSTPNESLYIYCHAQASHSRPALSRTLAHDFSFSSIRTNANTQGLGRGQPL